MNGISLAYQTDEEIIRDYSETGNQMAANAFVRKYKKFVYSIAFRYLNDYDDADDASQEVFIKALTNLSKFRGECSLNTWLYRITVNVCTNITRKKKIKSIFKFSVENEEYLNIPSKDPAPDRIMENEEIEQNFLKALNELPKKQRETFYLRYFDGLSYNEISKMLGTSVGGLKANYYQAVKKIAQILKTKI